MARYRHALPQLRGEVLLTDSGLETDLIFHHGFDLPLFAAFPLLDDPKGVEVLRDYYRQHAVVAQDANLGFVFEAVTWRASTDWASQLGYTEQSLADVNRRAIELGVNLRAELGEDAGPMVISGAIGPRGDAYNPGERMTPEEAQRYHSAQIETLSATQADLVTAFTLTYPAEGIGIVRACRAADMPVVISFTVETDGALPDGTGLGEAIAMVDDATNAAPAYYGINCAHPTHFIGVLDPTQDWVQRIRMVRANASRKSHAELDEADELDDGDPDDLGRQYVGVRARLPRVSVLGGCCGTDVRHVRAIARACF